jgi:tetratricopeptide (TPR) repeat protein
MNLVYLERCTGPEKRVAVVFSSANAKTFTYYKTFSVLQNIDLVFIRDPMLDSWYLNGIGGMVDTWPKLMNQLFDLLRAYKSGNISFWGSSMGGYAAIKASFGFPGSFCFAMSPQTTLDHRLPHNINKQYMDIKSDVDELFFRPQALGRQYVFFGASDIVDIYYIQKYGIGNESCFPLRGGDHLSSALINKVGFLTESIRLWLSDESHIIFSKAESFQLYRDGAFYDANDIRLIKRIVESYYIAKDYSECLLVINEFLLDHENNAGALMLRGHIFANMGDIVGCIKCFESATQSLLNRLEPGKQLGKILVKAKLYDQAVLHLEYALEARHNDYDSLCLIAEAYYYNGKISKARDALIKACEVRPNMNRVSELAKRLNLFLE